MTPTREERLRKLLDRLRASVTDDPKAANLLSVLESELEGVERERAETEQQLQQYAEAYEKLTAPANRIGVFIRHQEESRALIALGDTDYLALIDPKFEQHERLVTGARVLLNDAYAVIGVMDDLNGGSVQKVAEVLDDGRLRVSADSAGGQGRLVVRSAELADRKIQKGDEVRIEPQGRVAVEHFAHEDTRDYFIEAVPEVPWSQIGGQQDAIKVIRDTIELPLLHPELYARFDKKPVKGILLYGPPGCGKTLIGKATAYNLAREYSEKLGHEVKECFLHISGPKILNMWLGETERMVREIFEVARNKAKEGHLVVIFIDEAESILRTRSGGRWLNISNTVVPQFCAEMDGILGLENVVVILTSNRPDYIDPAILRPERIDRKVKVRRPDLESARAILSIYLHPCLPLDAELVEALGGDGEAARQKLIDEAVKVLWREDKSTEFVHVFSKNGQQTTLHHHDLVSGALLKSVVDRAKDFAIARAIAEPEVDHGVRLEDLERAIAAEYGENEIFPKSDVLEDWLKLIDVEPESVVSVRPVRDAKRPDYLRKSVI